MERFPLTTRLSISIHSLRMEGDVKIVPNSVAVENFNPLPPYGGRLVRSVPPNVRKISIHSLRMEGDALDVQLANTIVISIHSLRMEGDVKAGVLVVDFLISIHSLRMEGDFTISSVWSVLRNFNPLPPYGGRLPLNALTPIVLTISIHSLRMEGDYKCAIIYTEVRDFNPLPPYGGRHP